MTVARHVLVTGLVQGVGYRNWTRWTATDLGLSGWVRNRRTGEVEALFSGDESTVDTMVDACREGPPGARVDAVDVLGTTAPVTGAFKVLPTE